MRDNRTIGQLTLTKKLRVVSNHWFFRLNMSNMSCKRMFFHIFELFVIIIGNRKKQENRYNFEIRLLKRIYDIHLDRIQRE